MQPILAYNARWHAESNSGRLYLKLDDESVVHLSIDSPAELAALCELLRRFPQMSWDEETAMISTGWTKPGTHSRDAATGPSSGGS